MDVTLPNGRVIQGVPEGTSRDEIKAKAIAAGLAVESDFPQAGQAAPAPQAPSFVQALTGNAPQTEQSQMQAQVMGGGLAQRMAGGGQPQPAPGVFSAPELNEFSFRAVKAGLGGLLEGDPRELQQIIQSNYPEAEFTEIEGQPAVTLPSGQYLLNPEGVDPLDVARFGTDMAAFIPAGRVAGAGLRKLGQGMAMAGGTQAAMEGAEAAVGGEFNPEDVAMAAAFQGGGQVAGEAISQAGRAIRGTPTQEAQDIIEAGRQFDVPVTTSDVAPPRTGVGRASQVMAENVPLVGTGGLRATQQEARERATDAFIEQYQGGSYDAIVQSMKNKRDDFTRRAGQTYESVIPQLNEAAESSGGIPFTNTSRAIENARQVLATPERISSPRALDLLDEIQENVTGSGQSFQTLKDNIGAWQEKLDSIDPAVRSQLSSNDKRLLSRVLSALRSDRDSFAESALSPRDYRRLKSADAAYGEAARNLRETRLKNIFDKGDTTPEVARNMLFSNKPSEVRNLYQSLDTEGRKNARAVIIGDIVGRLTNRATRLTPSNFAEELNKNRELLDIFFRDDRRQELNGIRRLLEATRGAQKAQASFTANTGERLIPWAVAGGAYFEPSVAAAFGSVGALGRLYESPRVRTVLSRMANVSPESREFEALIDQYRQAVTSVAQSIREEDQ